jgi:hypothetical protein
VRNAVSKWGEGYDWSAAEPEEHVGDLDRDVELGDKWKEK